MSQILVRDLSAQTVRRLKSRARASGRSLQAEAKALIERHAPQLTGPEALEELDELCALAGRQTSDSTDLIREDRAR